MTVGGLSLDTGALIALERGDRNLRQLLRRALSAGVGVHVVCEVVAEAWRGGPRQAVLARFLNLPEVVFPVMDVAMARVVGDMCARSGHSDVVDVHVVMDARMNGHTVVTSDPDDLRRVDPSLGIITL
jgi:predicted nucleic acid-binding protein